MAFGLLYSCLLTSSCTSYIWWLCPPSNTSCYSNMISEPRFQGLHHTLQLVLLRSIFFSVFLQSLHRCRSRLLCCIFGLPSIGLKVLPYTCDACCSRSSHLYIGFSCWIGTSHILQGQASGHHIKSYGFIVLLLTHVLFSHQLNTRALQQGNFILLVQCRIFLIGLRLRYAVGRESIGKVKERYDVIGIVYYNQS